MGLNEAERKSVCNKWKDHREEREMRLERQAASEPESPVQAVVRI